MGRFDVKGKSALAPLLLATSSIAALKKHIFSVGSEALRIRQKGTKISPKGAFLENLGCIFEKFVLKTAKKIVLGSKNISDTNRESSRKRVLVDEIILNP